MEANNQYLYEIREHGKNEVILRFLSSPSNFQLRLKTLFLDEVLEDSKDYVYEQHSLTVISTTLRDKPLDEITISTCSYNKNWFKISPSKNYLDDKKAQDKIYAFLQTLTESERNVLIKKLKLRA